MRILHIIFLFSFGILLCQSPLKTIDEYNQMKWVDSVYSSLNEDEKIELDVELSNISDKSNLIYSMPFHCSVGWKKP